MTAPPEGYGQWSGPLLMQALGDVSDDQVWRILRKYDICLQRRRSWCISTDPEFGPKAADIVGLYLDPPVNALVVCVDEKPSIQALERAQGWLRLPNGKCVNGYSHGYKRHGTTTLFAALDIATGQVKAGHYTRRRRREFLDYMNGIVSNHPGREIHVILDNLNTHKPKFGSVSSSRRPSQVLVLLRQSKSAKLSTNLSWRTTGQPRPSSGQRLLCIRQVPSTNTLIYASRY